MIVCICHCVSDRDIEREARRGCASFEALQEELFVATACGACDSCARRSFERACAGHASTAQPGHAHAGHAAHAPHLHAQPALPYARPRRQVPIFFAPASSGTAA